MTYPFSPSTQYCLVTKRSVKGGDPEHISWANITSDTTECFRRSMLATLGHVKILWQPVMQKGNSAITQGLCWYNTGPASAFSKCCWKRLLKKSAVCSDQMANGCKQCMQAAETFT